MFLAFLMKRGVANLPVIESKDLEKKSALAATKTDFNQEHKKTFYHEYYNIDSLSKSSYTSNSNTLTVSGDDVPSILRINREIEKKFLPKKKSTFPLSRSYQRIGEDKRALRVLECGTFLEFAREVSSEKCTLQNANFCRDRLCPMCSWRRSYKIFGQVSKIMDHIENDFEFIFLTLTVPNVSGSELSSKIDQMQKAFRQMMQFDKRIRKVSAGYFKALEVTHNKNRHSKSFNTFHPHFHVILAVDKGYLKSDYYLKRSDFLDIWRRVIHDDSITQVDVRLCKNKSSSECQEAERSLSSAVAEVAKYSVKSNDYIIPWSEELTDTSVRTYLSALTSRRLCSFGGIFDQVRKALAFDDCEDGDLVHVEADKLRADVALQIYRYAWSSGVYKLIAVDRKVNPVIDAAEDDY